MSLDERVCPPAPPRSSISRREHWPAEGFVGTQPGVFNAATALFPDMAAFRARDWTRKDRFIYGPHGTPTTFELEARIAQLEGAQHCLLCPSGLSAITLTYISLLKPGDEVLVPINVYAANRTFVIHELVSWGVLVRLYDPTTIESLEIGDATRLIWVEAPCAMTFEFPDVPAITEKARRAGVLTAMDSTWGAGVALRPFDLGVDIAVQSLSKFASGGGDNVMGAVSCTDKGVYDVLKLCAMRMGLHTPGIEAASVLKGLDTLPLRYRSQDEATRFLVRHLALERTVGEVLHPSLESCIGHAFWRRDCVGAAGIFSVVFDECYSQQEVDDFIDELELFRIGYGWGGPLSLVLSYGRSVASVRPLRGELVRFSVGLEDPADLLADIRRALASLSRSR